MPSGLPWSEQFIEQLSDKEVRDSYVADRVRIKIARLIRALREQEDRGWSQSELGERMNKPQSVVSRLEDPDYGKASLQTLLEVAAAYDLPLFIDIPEWEDWFRLMREVPSQQMHRRSFCASRMIAQAQAAKKGIANGKISHIDSNEEVSIRGQIGAGNDSPGQSIKFGDAMKPERTTRVSAG